MFLRPILGALARPVLYTPVKTTRSLRPSIKIGKEQFKLTLDVHHYNKDEIRVRAHPEYVVIEGKQEKTTQQGYVLRQFIRKFKLPDGCIPGKIESRLSPEGILTITAPRSHCDSTAPCNSVTVPIAYGPTDKEKSENPEDPNAVSPTDPGANDPKNNPKDK